MKIAGGVRWPLILEALCLAISVALLPLQAVAAEPVNLEGTWKISVPQASFKPEGGAIPFTASGRAQYQDNKRKLAKGDNAYDNATARCASPGVPRLMLTPDRFRIWQRPGHMMFQFEWNRLFRQVDMGGLAQPQLRTGEGSSAHGGDDDALVGRAIPIAKGHWEGDTLVLTSQGFNDTTLVDNLVPHGYDLKTTERFRLKSANLLEVRITIEDPEYFTRPWQAVVTYDRQANVAFGENVCLERHFATQRRSP